MSEWNHGVNFQRPPVVEVVCGIQFSGPALNTTHFGAFRERIRAKYSEIEERPPLPRFEEDGSVRNEMSILPPLRRVFFVEPPGNFLAQLQAGRFLHNWRQQASSDPYPRFHQAFARFVELWEHLNRFVADEKLEALRPELFELTYINHISSETTKFPQDLDEFLAFYHGPPDLNQVAGDMEALSIQSSWPLLKGLGTLRLDLKHGVRANDQRPVIVMELTARGKASQPMDQWFSEANRTIVLAFERLTTAVAHKSWGKD